MKIRASHLTLGAVLFFLILSKIVISGVYLQSKSVPFATTGLAMAESRTASGPVPDRAAFSDPVFLENADKKTQDLNAREIDLQRREKDLIPLKNEIEEKLTELNDLQVRLTAYAKKLADREKALEDAQMGHLVNLYTAMEPAKAAAIMGKLKIDTVVLILRNMKGKSAGKIVAMMNPERGALISERLTRFD